METLLFNVGDLIYYNKTLCPITSLSSIGVTIKQGKTHRFVDCNDLIPRKFEHCIKFTKGDLEGESHTDTEEKAKAEKNLLESMGWNCKIYKREVV
jgi:hypothetical protein